MVVTSFVLRGGRSTVFGFIILDFTGTEEEESPILLGEGKREKDSA